MRFPKERMQQLASTTTIHGVNELVLGGSKSIQLVWGSFMAASIGFLMYLLYGAIAVYWKNPTAMTISFREDDQLFNIYFALMCLNGTRIHELGLEERNIQYMLSHIENPVLPLLFSSESYTAIDESDPQLEIDTRDILASHGFQSFYQVLDDISYDVTEVFTERFTSENDKIPYNARKIVNEGGVYYEMTVNLTGKTTIMVFDSLRFRLNMDTLPFTQFQSTRMPFSSIAFMWLGENPTPFQSRLMRPIKPSTIYQYWVQQVETTYLNKPTKPCKKTKETADVCRESCSASKCDDACTWFRGEESDAEGQYCNLFHQPNTTCRMLKYEDCESQCRDPCTTRQYNIESIEATHQVGGDTYVWIYIKDNGLVLVMEEEYIYSWSIIISNVGGLLGVCLGASILSVFHLLYFWCIKPLVLRKVHGIHGKQ